MSILMVVWHHTGHNLENSLPKIFGYGYHGVTIFFVISGFLITTLLLREREKYGRISFKLFFARRALRIFPLYYAVLLLYCALVALVENESKAGIEFWKNLPYFLTYTSNYFVDLSEGRTIFYFSWSLAAEEQYYLVWPLLLTLIPLRLAYTLMATLMLLIVAMLAPFKFEVIRISSQALEHIPFGLTTGTLLATCLHHQASFNTFQAFFKWSLAPVLYLLILLILLEVGVNLALWVPITTTLLLGSLIVTENKSILKFVELKSLVLIGKISYGIYLFHVLCANLVKRAFGFAEVELSALSYFILTVSLVIAISWVSYNTFEKYFLLKKVKYKNH